MKKLLNTLYVMTPGSDLNLKNNAVVVAVGGEEKVRIPLHTIDSIVCFGNMTVTTPLISSCGENGIAVTFLSEYGRFYGRTVGPAHGNILLRKAQFQVLNDPEKAKRISQCILLGKLTNSRELLMRAAREQSDQAAEQRLRTAAGDISQLTGQMDGAQDIDTLRGLEGAAAHIYFSVFDDMVKPMDAEMLFRGRSRQPPEDPVNAILSFLYTLLKNDMQSALEGVGLDPACGYLHTLRPGRPALALDLMEELRAPLCDRLALALINRGQITQKSFETLTVPFHLNEDGRKTVLTAWQKRKRETINHPFLSEKIDIGLLPHCQAMLLARVLRGDLDEYPPFHWR